MIYNNFNIDKLKAKALEYIEKEDSQDKDAFIFSETTINGKVKDLYGNIPVINKDFNAILNKPIIKFKSKTQKCVYSNKKYICKNAKLTSETRNELKYIEYATKDEEGTIHIYERYVSFKEVDSNYDMYKDYSQKEKITTISKEEKYNSNINVLIEKYKTIPTYEHIFKKDNGKYYLYETRLKI